MNTPQTIKELAYQRLVEAETLAHNQMFDGAFYLLGYSEELMLKAKICEHWNVPYLLAENQNNAEHGVSYLRKTIMIHDLRLLLFFSGLKKDFDKEKETNKVLLKANSLLFGIWNENARYKPCGYHEDKDVVNLINILEDLLLWIEHK